LHALLARSAQDVEVAIVVPVDYDRIAVMAFD
jgi:hypothetical protein